MQNYFPQHLDGNWRACTLCRSLRQSRDVLETAARRKVEWPERKEYGRSPVEVGQVLLVGPPVCAMVHVTTRCHLMAHIR